MDSGGINGNHGSKDTMPSADGMDMNMHHGKEMLMHMTFFWGKNTEVVFSGWPGTSLGMYLLSLIVVFVISVLLEWISTCNLIKPGTPRLAAGLMQTLMHTLRMGLAYLVMLALMSFNGGIFIVAVAGHSVGFLIFGSRMFKPENETPVADLPPMKC
ncbi:copper transporter 6 [Cinnamomum micranthum f. kanehirae]|uniref:Copper transport protein n=1 Tax=Cinnamomum micranthum f. kanehirae TaxID=337451 RepID=A0A443NCJ2_9MAGN|nr:copper transporter 6 [Cinnamomum micranthum f. kanehirae]